jgi:hypothetical protein
MNRKTRKGVKAEMTIWKSDKSILQELEQFIHMVGNEPYFCISITHTEVHSSSDCYNICPSLHPSRAVMLACSLVYWHCSVLVLT